MTLALTFTGGTHITKRIHINACTKTSSGTGQHGADHIRISLRLIQGVANFGLSKISESVQLVRSVHRNGRYRPINCVNNFFVYNGHAFLQLCVTLLRIVIPMLF